MRTSWVSGWPVSPHARGRGVGRALLREALSLARPAPGFQQVNAANAVAIRLYVFLGFRQYALEPGAIRIEGELHDELHMFLPLGAG